MKRYFIIFAVIIIVILLGAWSYSYYKQISDPGLFSKWGHLNLRPEVKESGKSIYAGYPFRWEGHNQAALEKVEFLKQDGTILSIDDEQIYIKVFATRMPWGAFPEKHAIKEGRLDDLEPVKGFKVFDQEIFTLVLKVNVIDPNYKDEIHALKMTFEKMGRIHTQDISFEKGIFINE